MTAVRWVLSQLRAQPWPAAAFLVAVTVTVTLATLAPRAATGLSAAAMSGAFDTLTAQQGDLVARWTGPPLRDAALPDPAGAALDSAEKIRAEQPRPLRDILEPPQLVAELGYPIVVTPPPASGYHRLTFAVLVDATLDTSATLTSGTWPAAPDPGDPVSDAIIPHDTAVRLGWTVGSEPLPGIRLSGTFRPIDPGDRRWEQVPRGVRYAELEDPNLGTELVSAVFVDRRALSAGVSGTRPQISHRLWFGIDSAAVVPERADAGALSDQLTAMLARAHELAEGRNSVRFFSDLGETLRAVALQQRTLGSLLLVLAAGPLAIAVMLVALSAAALRQRRAENTRLLRARGLARRQLTRWAAAEMAVLALTGGVVGHLTADLLWPIGAGAWQWAVTLPLCLALGAALPLVLLGDAHRGRRDLDAPGPRSRWALEGLLIAVAATSVALLFGAAPGGSVDVLAGAAPALVTAAAGVLVWRLHPIVLRLLAQPLKAGRGLAGPLGLLRALRGAVGGIVPLMAVLLGVSVSVAGGVLATSLDTTSRDAAWAVNGGDVRVAGPRMTDDLVARIRAVDGVAAVARLSRIADAVPLTAAGETQHVGVWSADAELRVVYRGTPSDPQLPEALFEPGAEPTPIVLGGEATLPDVPARLGGVGQVSVLDSGASLPGAGTPAAWAVVDAETWASAGGAPGTPSLALVALEPGASADEVATALREQLATAAVTTVAEQLRGRHVPAARAFASIAGVSAAVTLTLMTLAVLGAEALAGAARRTSTARLRALGVPPSEIRRSVAWELGPGLLMALGSGTGLGLGIAALLLRALDYGFITGAAQATFSVDVTFIGIVVGLVLAASAAAILSAGRRATQQQEAS